MQIRFPPLSPRGSLVTFKIEEGDRQCAGVHRHFTSTGVSGVYFGISLADFCLSRVASGEGRCKLYKETIIISLSLSLSHFIFLFCFSQSTSEVGRSVGLEE